MINYNKILVFLNKIDKKLRNKIILIAIGGTAIVFMKLKESTKDIDFCIEEKSFKEFKNILKEIKEKIFKIDLFTDGYIFCQQLPKDYIKLSKPYKTDLKNIELKLLHPIDIIITKTARLNERDKEDISILIKKKKIKKEKLIERFKEIKKSYPASDKDLEYHFDWVLRTFFK